MIATLIGLPRWAQGLGLAALALAAFLLWDWWDDRAAVAAHEAELAEEVRAIETAAAIDAAEAITETKQEVERENAEARDAASRSDDVLKSGLDRLRH